jgi:hypothetical protein
METYQVEFPTNKPRLQNKLFGALCFSCLLFSVRFGWFLLSPDPFETSAGTVHNAIKWVIWALLMGVSCTFVAGGSSKPRYAIQVSEDSITGIEQYSGWMRGHTERRTVSKGAIRTIFEVKGSPGKLGGIAISEKSEFDARMFGFIFVPADLPRFQEIKQLAESWKISQ